MKALYKKLTGIIIFLTACAVFALGLICAYKPVRASAAEESAFKIGTEMRVSSANGLIFQVEVPESYKALLNQGETVTEESVGGVLGYTEWTYTNYLLYINRASEESAYWNMPSATSPGYGDGYHVNPSACESPYYTGTAEQLPSGFFSNTVTEFSFDIPTNIEQGYYYYVTIAKATHTKHQASATGNVTNEIAFEVVAVSSNYCYNSLKGAVTEQLERDSTLPDSEREWLQETAEIKPSTAEIPVTLKYKTLTDYATPTENSYTFNLKGAYAQNKTLAVTALYSLAEYSNIADFNAVYTGAYWRDGYVYTTQERIILQARDFVYSYNPTTEKGTLEVVYNDFQYKDLSLRITNNDPMNNLTLDYYTSDAVVGASSTTLTYNFEDIEEQLYNSCNWLFDFGKENIRITGTPSGVSTELTDTALKVTFPNDKESELVNLSLIGVAEIIEDIEYTLTYEYVQLGYSGGELTETVKRSEPIAKMYSEIVTYNYTNFMTDYGDGIISAVSPEILGGAEYYIPASIRKEYSAYDSETHTCKITVEYTYNTLFKITNNYDAGVTFKALNHSSLLYTGEYFVADVPDGYRVESFSTTEAYKDKLLIANAEDYRNAKIEVRTDTNAKDILPIEINFTDSWNLIVNYLENYVDYGVRNREKDADGNPVRPSFAEKKVFSGAVKISDLADVYHPTAEEMKRILGVQSLDILGLATVESIGVTFDGISTYTATLAYSYAALKQIDYNGNVKEIKIPLTSYADWCEEYGKDWSILYLNTTTRHYFKYSNDVLRENLYGFFSVAVFKEQVSDLNFYFKNNTGDGCMTIFSQSEVRGSGVYQFFARLGAKGGFLGPLLGVPLISLMCMNLCELVDDDNAIYYSYFFYLDGTSDNPYLSNGGADSADDTDSAIKNAFNDAKEWIQNIFGKASDSTAGRIIKILLGVALVVLSCTAIFAGVYKILDATGVLKAKRTAGTAPKAKKKPKEAKKTSVKKPTAKAPKKTSAQSMTKKRARTKK